MHVAAIVPAAGVGRRLGGRTRKAFVPLDGVPLLIHTLRALQESPLIRWIIPVVEQAHVPRVRALLTRYRISKALAPQVGGRSRSQSVARGMAALPDEAEWVLVHDGARPCVSRRLIRDAVRAVARTGAVACGLPASVTVKAVDGERRVSSTLDRTRLWFAQTPQVFRRDWLSQAMERAAHRLHQFPDDAALLEWAGFPVRMVPGDAWNLKVTTREDLVLAAEILRQREKRPVMSSRQRAASRRQTGR